MASYAIAVRTNALPERVCPGLPLSFFKAGAWLLSPGAGNVAPSNLLGGLGGPPSYEFNEIEFDQNRSSGLYLRKTSLTFQNGALAVKHS